MDTVQDIETRIAADGAGIDQHPRPSRGVRRLAERPGPAAAAAAAPSTHDKDVAQKAFNRAGPLGSNGDEADFPNYIGNYHKGLPHNDLGEVIKAHYDSLVKAISAPPFMDPAFEDAIHLFSDTMPYGRPLVNPQAGFSEDTEGPAPDTLQILAPPKVNSAEAAAEMVELYWMALLRDVPFAQFASNTDIEVAAKELSGLSEFRGPRDKAGKVTSGTIFRGSAIGDLTGPFVSQFLLKDIPYGSLTIDARQTTVLPPAAKGFDYLVFYEDWRNVQNGRNDGLPEPVLDSKPQYIRTMRDLAHYVHVDALYEAYLNACLILLGLDAPVDDGNPYKNKKSMPPKKQAGFATFGGPHILSLVTEVATRALKAVWYQKWAVHRRLRPEAYGGLVHLNTFGLNGVKTTHPIDATVLDSKALEETALRNGTHLLPIAFPEGSPTHPAYGAGHATVAGACVTVLKAWFDETWQIPDPVQPAMDGAAPAPYEPMNLTVGGELNKIAANIAIGRNMAGVHWRTDYVESLKLGETVAIEILKQQLPLCHEKVSLSFTKFDGSPVTVS